MNINPALGMNLEGAMQFKELSRPYQKEAGPPAGR